VSEDPLVELLGCLRSANYHFITPTPETHRRVIERRSEAKDLRDVFGWSLPFAAELLPARLVDLLREAEMVQAEGDLLESRLRVSSLYAGLFLHSAYPTDDADSVFFGPDTYRFADFVRGEIARMSKARRLVDIGSGSGAGGISAAPLLADARVTLTDVNPLALRLAKANALHAGVTVELVEGAGLDCVEGPIDLIIANPPYIMDEQGRTYRSGGDMHGAGMSLDWTLAGARRLEPGGRMLLYTGSAILSGRDGLRERLEAELPQLSCSLSYREIDPDVFGEELDKPAYADVERIAVVGAVIAKA